MREIVTGACPPGPIQRAESRESAIGRMPALLHRAADAGCTLAVFPELALTTIFPRWMMEGPAEIDAWFERSMPGGKTGPRFQAARERGTGIGSGYAEPTPDGTVAGELAGEEDGLVVVPCDPDRRAFGKRTLFDFARQRRPERCRLIAEWAGAEPPPAG